MSRFLFDVNTVLALLDPRHVFHDAAHGWLGQQNDLHWLTSPIIQNGVIRVASNARYPNHLGTSGQVRGVLQDFCNDARHEFCPDDVSLLDNTRLTRPELLTPPSVTDLYLVALALHHRAQLATFDARIPAAAIRGGPGALSVIE